jgi:hypothetical protein
MGPIFQLLQQIVDNAKCNKQEIRTLQKIDNKS